MGDRAQQIVSEWFVKCANVVIQSRLAAGATERAPRERQNRWVRPPTTPRGPTATATESPLANAPRPTRAPSTLRVVLDVTRPPTPLASPRLAV